MIFIKIEKQYLQMLFKMSHYYTLNTIFAVWQIF